MKYVPDDIKVSGLSGVISYIFSYRKKRFVLFSSMLQFYLVVGLVLFSVKLFATGSENLLSFSISFVIPLFLGYVLLSLIYVALYVEELKKEKEKRIASLQSLVSANKIK